MSTKIFNSNTKTIWTNQSKEDNQIIKLQEKYVHSVQPVHFNVKSLEELKKEKVNKDHPIDILTEAEKKGLLNIKEKPALSEELKAELLNFTDELLSDLSEVEAYELLDFADDEMDELDELDSEDELTNAEKTELLDYKDEAQVPDPSDILDQSDVDHFNNFSVGKCCFCGTECNPASQSCGQCLRNGY